jgi:hypothetical protein
MRKIFRRFLVAFLTFLIGVVGASYHRDYQLRHRELLWQECRLRDSLFWLRRSIDVYTADKGEMPQSLDDLVKAEYLEDVPFDPITHRRAWKIVVGNDPNSVNGKQGIIDVRSSSSIISSRGTAYEEW